MTRSQADAAIAIGAHNQFLVRHDSNKLVLTKKSFSQISHTIILRSPKGYQLEEESKLFDKIPEMILHYQQSLGTPVEKGKILVPTKWYSMYMAVHAFSLRPTPQL